MDRNDPMMRGIFGDEFMDVILPKSQPALRKVVPVTPAPLPGQPGFIPTARPKGSTPTSRKQEIRELCGQSLAQVGWNEEVLTSLVEAMASYLEQQIG
jgi:hypothetical protein